MIKFFRKIRQNLLSENKFSKYLFYAIGEIILVFIGIAMALQFNNWNEAKKTREKEQQVLTEIISDLEFTLQDIDRVTNTRTNNLKRAINSMQTIINALETDQPYHDSLAFNFRATNSYSDVNFKTSGYQSLVSIGTDLVEQPELRSAIGQFHTSTINRVKGTYQEIHLDFYSYMINHYRKKFTSSFNENDVEKLIPLDFEVLKKDNEYIQSLKTFLGVNLPYLDILNTAKDDAEKLKEDIENYLK